MVIIDNLQNMGIKTYTGKDRFSKSVVRAILQNEKYCGDLLLQKDIARGIGSGLRDKTIISKRNII